MRDIDTALVSVCSTFDTAVSDLRGCVCQISTGGDKCFRKVTVKLTDKNEMFFFSFRAYVMV